nr:prolyl oligopeptidase family serine peptidase [Polymorphobacter sp.]
MRYLIGVAALALASPAVADDIAARFAARPAATSVALSPDGDKIVYVGAYKTGGYAVTVADLKTGETKMILAGSALDVTPRRCGFKSETRLICTLYGVFDVAIYRKASSFIRLMAIDTDGGNRKLIGEKRGGERYGGAILDWLPDDPDHVLMEASAAAAETTGSNIKPAAEGTGAALVDVHTGARRFIERPSPQVLMLAADGHGNVRLRGTGAADPDGIMRDTMTYAVRAKGNASWLPLSHVALSDQRATEFVGFDASGDHVYQLAGLEGRQALYAVSTDGTATRTLVFSHPEVDVDGVLRIGKYRRPVAAEYTLERGEFSYFDPELAALSRSLAKALPGHPGINITGESWDGTKKLILADAASTPDKYYLYDTSARKLAPLVDVYPALDGVALGTVKAVRYAAHDGTMIPGFLTLPPGHSDARGLPGLVMPHGGPSARDAAGFDWLPQFFAAQGYAVLQPNFRGSSGYGDAFFAKNGFQSWPLAIGDVNDGARWLVTQGVDAKKLEIFGWSYGGYAALQANVLDPGLYRAAVAVAPVTDLAMLRDEYLHFTNVKLIDAMVGQGPHVLAGSPARNAAKIVAPVLIFHADHDLNVDIEQSRAMVAALRSAGRKVDFVEYKGFDHQIDDTVAREDLLAKSAAFLKAGLN